MNNHERLLHIPEINAEINPGMCKECEEKKQVRYWRTFTDTSLRTFITNKFYSTVPDVETVIKKVSSQGKEYLITDEDELEVPGVLWATPKPIQAMSVGLSRAIIEGEHIHILGITHCPHRAAEGVKGYRAIPENKEVVLYPLTLDPEIDTHGLTTGTVFNRFSEKQVEAGVLYSFNECFLEKLRAIYRIDPYPPGKREIFDVFHTLYAVMTDMELDRDRYSDMLSSIFRPLMHPVTLTHALNASATPSARNEFYRDTYVADHFVERFRSLRFAEHERETKGEIYRNLGGIRRHEALSEELLQVVQKSFNFDAVPAELQSKDWELRKKLRMMNYYAGKSPDYIPPMY